MRQELKDWLGKVKNLKLYIIILAIVTFVILFAVVSKFQFVKPYKKEIRDLEKQNKELVEANRDLVQEQEENSIARQELIKEIDFLNFTIDEREERINILSTQIRKVRGSFSKLSNDELYKELLHTFRADTIEPGSTRQTSN